MAFQRSVATSNLLVGVSRKTKEVGVEKRMTTRGGVSRAALGNISNKTSVLNAKTDAASKQTLDGALKKTQEVGGEKKLITKSTRSSSDNVMIKKEVASSDINVMKEVKSEGSVDDIATREEQNLANLSTSSSGAMDISENSDNASTTEVAFSNQMYNLMLRDIDEEDIDNPQLCSEYVKDIYSYMSHLENEMTIKENHLQSQPEINGRMRAILVDWLVQVHQKFHMLQETLFLSIAILDRFLQLESVPKTKLQLAGVSAMWIAAKYEEMYAPEVADFAYITDHAYTKSDIRQMECKILRTLDFSLGRPLPIHFLRRFSKAGDVDARTHNLAKYFMELAIVPCELAHIKPSFLAAAALRLSQKLLGDYTWDSLMHFYTGYEETSLCPLMAKLARLVQNAGTGKTTAVKAKYQSSKLMKVSILDELGSDILKEISAWPMSPLFTE